MSIQQNELLFSLLGTTYGGDGQTNFRLPDFTGRAPVGMVSPNDKDFHLGNTGGVGYLQLTGEYVPLIQHSHTATPNITIKVFDGEGGDPSPINGFFANSPGGSGYSATAENQLAAPKVTVNAIPEVNVPAPTSLKPAYIVQNFIIAITGLYPSRP